MSVIRFALFALFGMMASACNLTEPGPKNFSLVNQRPAKAEEEGNTLEAAEKACKEETRTRGISNVVAIFSRFRKGAADADYVACMQKRGYEIKP